MRPQGGARWLQSRPVAANGDLLAAYARLAVRVGVNLQPGQRLAINGLLEHAPLVRAATAEAYAAGASYVDVYYSDQHVRRAHIEGAAGRHARLVAAVARRAAAHARRGRRRAALAHRQPGARALPRPRRRPRRPLADARARRGGPPADRRAHQLVDRRRSRTRAGRAPSSASRTSTGSGRRWRRRSGSTSPTRSRPGRSTSTGSRSASKALNERRFDALRYRGPGHRSHDRAPARVGLAVGPRGLGRQRRTFVANMPTEEVFTTPDAGASRERSPPPTRSCCSATSSATSRIRFEDGRAVEVDADEGRGASSAPTSRPTRAPRGSARSHSSTAPRASGRPASSSTTRSSTRTPPPTSRSATPSFPRRRTRSALATRRRLARGINVSSIHTDFMIGSPEVDIWGVDTAGNETPILANGDWVLPTL